jgi:hypothetical protein
MDCPQCGRPLAAGARVCVYCGRGTRFRPKETLKIPPREARARQGGIPWGKLLFWAILALAAAAAWATPQIRGLLPF